MESVLRGREDGWGRHGLRKLLVGGQSQSNISFKARVSKEIHRVVNTQRWSIKMSSKTGGIIVIFKNQN